MNLKEALAQVRARLVDAAVEEAELKSELLVRHVSGLDAAGLFLAFERDISAAWSAHLETLVSRHIQGEPLAYILGRREFYGLEFEVNPFVLIPRPETEHIIEKVLQLAGNLNTPSIADIGTGSGAIAITLAANLPGSEIYAVDISSEALEVASRNAFRHGVASQIIFLHGDLAQPLPKAVDILVANLPYVKSADCAGSCEPHMALDGGANGLEIIERLCEGLDGKICPGGSVLLEIGLGQAQAVMAMLKRAVPSAHIETMADLAGIERVVWGKFF
ncbi:MAG: peptide chain release factor N(5)-glutamine methyltransferase [Dehalococcoidia bacterium]|nr:peptide chain release factor N(5)-glutamine methyltransferase [Dehalococcoidia bacterium]